MNQSRIMNCFIKNIILRKIILNTYQSIQSDFIFLSVLRSFILDFYFESHEVQLQLCNGMYAFTSFSRLILQMNRNIFVEIIYTLKSISSEKVNDKKKR